MACQRIVSSSIQDAGRSERGAMSNAPAREFLAGPQSVRTDEPCSHAVRHRGDDVAGKIVAGEQHLSLRASGRRQHKVVEEGPACGTQAGMRAKRSGTGR